MSELGKLYPDLIEAGNLSTALQAAFSQIGSPLQVFDTSSTVLPFAYARVEAGKRSSQLYVVAKDRLFLSDFWSLGVCLAHGGTPSLVDTAKAIDTWLTASISSGVLATTYSFVRPEEDARIFEAGEEVEWKWLCMEKSILKHFPELVSFFEIAKNTQILRMLFPYTSHNVLCFSRCTGWPYSGDCPCVVPVFTAKGKVVTPFRYKVCLGQTELGEGDAVEAGRIVVQNLPVNIGPAVPGTADDLLEQP